MKRIIRALLCAGFLFVGAKAEAAAPLEDYGKLPVMTNVEISPSGNRLAFVAAVDGVRRLYIKSVSDDQPLAVLPVGSAKVVDIGWAGDDHVLLFTIATVDAGHGDSDEFLNVFEHVSVVSLATHSGFDMFAKDPHVVEGIFGKLYAVLQDGHWFAYVKGYANGDCEGCIAVTSNLYKVDLDTGKFKIAAPGAPNTRDWVVGSDGSVIARTEGSGRTGDWRVLAGASGAQVIDSGQNKFGSGLAMGQGRVAGTVLITRPSTKESSLPGLEERPTALGATPIDQHLPNDPASVLFDHVSGLFIGYRSNPDGQLYTFFNSVIAARFEGAKKAFPALNSTLASYSDDFSRMVIFTDGDSDSGTYWLVDITTGKAKVLGEAYPTIESTDVAPTKMIEYKAADGLTIHAILTLPPGREVKSLPLIVLAHDGPASHFSPDFYWLAQAFASKGYAVLQPNYRGSSGYDQPLIEAGFGELGRKMQTDLSDGVAFLSVQGAVDKSRVCIEGEAFGGYSALAAVTLQHGLYRCAIAIAPITDLVDFQQYNMDRHGRDIASANFERFVGANANLSGISPISHAATADAPILMFHGKIDEAVPFSQSQAMDSRLRSAGKTSRLVNLGADRDDLMTEVARLTVLKESIDWVEKYNPSDPPK